MKATTDQINCPFVCLSCTIECLISTTPSASDTTFCFCFYNFFLFSLFLSFPFFPSHFSQPAGPVDICLNVLLSAFGVNHRPITCNNLPLPAQWRDETGTPSHAYLQWRQGKPVTEKKKTTTVTVGRGERGGSRSPYPSPPPHTRRRALSRDAVVVVVPPQPLPLRGLRGALWLAWTIMDGGVGGGG